MKCYQASYSEYGRGNYFIGIELIIWANTESEALGLALASDGRTKAKNWSIREMRQSGVHWISEEEH